MGILRSLQSFLISVAAFSFVFGPSPILAQTRVKEPEVTQVQTQKLDKIGVQLYTVRNEMEKDFEGTLRRIAALGFDEVEFAGLFGKDPRYVRQLLAELELKPVASHINWETLKNDPQAAIDETLLLGAEYMIIAWFPPETRDSLKDWDDWINLFNRVGKMCDEQGLKFAYHNHDFEFKELEGTVPFDLLLRKLDRRYTVFEIDLYWLALGGETPEDLFADYPGGFHLVHVKDLGKTGTAMVDVGDGRIDFAKIFKTAKTSGLKHYFVEHDTAEDPFKSLERSIKYLRALRY